MPLVLDFMTDWSVILSFIKWHLNIAALAVQRYIYVCHAPVAKQVMIYSVPHRSSGFPKCQNLRTLVSTDWWPCVCCAQWCTVSRSWLFVCLILVTAMVAMSPRVLDRNYDVTTTGTEKYNVSGLVSTYHIKIENRNADFVNKGGKI